MAILRLLFLSSLLFAFSCSPGKNDTSDCNSLVISDSLTGDPFERFEFNQAGKVIKYHIYCCYGINSTGFVDTFYYSGDQLIKSHMNINHQILPNPYITTEYFYNGNVLATSQTKFPSGTLVNTCQYVVDQIGNITQVSQVSTWDPTDPEENFTSRFEYDANSNLTKIYVKKLNKPEFLANEFSDYDNKPNPFYKLAGPFDSEFYLYSEHTLSKNNPGRRKQYQQLPNNIVKMYMDRTYTYTFNAQNKIIKRKYYDHSNNQSGRPEIFTYCQ